MSYITFDYHTTLKYYRKIKLKCNHYAEPLSRSKICNAYLSRWITFTIGLFIDDLLVLLIVLIT